MALKLGGDSKPSGPASRNTICAQQEQVSRGQSAQGVPVHLPQPRGCRTSRVVDPGLVRHLEGLCLCACLKALTVRPHKRH